MCLLQLHGVHGKHGVCVASRVVVEQEREHELALEMVHVMEMQQVQIPVVLKAAVSMIITDM